MERASEASSAEQVNELAVRVNEGADERVAQYLCPDFKEFAVFPSDDRIYKCSFQNLSESDGEKDFLFLSFSRSI